MTQRTISTSTDYMNDYNRPMVGMISFNPDREIKAYDDLKPPKQGEEELFSYMAAVLFFSMAQSRSELMKYVANDIESKWPNTIIIHENEKGRIDAYVKEYAN